MATSLAEQLQKLSVPQTAIYKRDKKRPSLLFDPKEAAKLDRETIYEIGIDGLEELIQRDPAFEQFKNTLFHATAKDFQRSMENTEANQRLDINIRKFLFLLSPHFLFNCSYKALEWLIHRFNIYDFNKEDLLMLVLPYHETNIFVRVVQLLHLRSAHDKWTWFKTLQKSGVHLTKQVLYNHAASDPYFLEFTSNLVLSTIKEFENPEALTVMFKYYCTTYVGALEYTKVVSELQVTHMLPVLLKGLTSDIPDFLASSYIIVAKLLIKTSLASTILEKFVNKIAQMSVPSLKTEAGLVLVTVYKSQPQLTTMSDVAFTKLRDKEGFTKLAQVLNGEDVDVYPFLKVLFLCGIGRILNGKDNEADKKFINELFNDLKISDEFVDVLLVSILELYSKNSELSDADNEWLRDFVRRIERQYPIAFDTSVKKIMKPTDHDTKSLKKILRKLINNLASIERGYDLFEKLYHSNSAIKIEGVRILLEHFDDFYQKDLTMLQNSLTDCFNDDDWEVVVEALNLFKPKLNKIFNDDTLTDLLAKLLTNYPNNTEAWSIVYAALDVTCTCFTDTNVKLLIYILPFLLPTCQTELRAAKQVVVSSYGKKSKLVSSCQKELVSCETPNQFCDLILSSLKNSSHLPPITSVIKVLKEIPQETLTALQKQVAILLLSNCLPQNNESGVSLLVLDIFENYLNTSKVSIVKGECSTYNYLAMSKKDKFTLQGFLYGVKTLIMKTRKEKVTFELLDLTVDSETSRLYIRILKMLVEGCCTQKSRSAAFFETLNVFFKHFCGGDLDPVVKLLLNIAIAENELIDLELRISCLKLVKTLMQNESSKLEPFLKFQDVTVPYILVIFTMASSEIRELGVDLLKILSSNSDARASNYSKLLAKLLTYQEEILLDHDQIPMMLFNTLSPEATASDAVLMGALNSLIAGVGNFTYPIYLKGGIVTLLSYVNSLDVYSKTSKLALKILRQLEQTSRKASPSESIILYRNFLRFDWHIASQLKLGTPIWTFVEESITNDSSVIEFQNSTTYPAVFLLKQIDRELFSQLDWEVQKSLIELVINLATKTQNVDALHAAGQVFKKIDLDVSLILKQLQKMRDADSPESDPTKRKSLIPTLDILETAGWKNGITVLEFIQDKKKIKNATSLLSVLFDILKKCLDFDEQSNLEYPKQLVLSTILHCCNRMEVGERLPESSFNMHSVVQCIRVSSNPQTHHHALLLLAHVSKLIPQQIMTNIISIFTFVGSSVLRHDDAYSFQIMSKIIETVIPILVKDDNEESICSVLRVFVDAVLDVPEHRRMPVLLQLLTSLNPTKNLYLFLLILFEAHVTHAQEERQKAVKEKGENDYLSKRLDIASDLLREFPVETIIVTCIKTFQYLRNLPEHKEDNYTKNTHIYDMKYCTLKQFRHYKYTIVTFFSSLLASKKFVLKVAQVPDAELLKMECLFKELIINILSFIQHTSKIAQRNTNTPQAQYWKVMLNHCFDILDAINSLLHSKMFLVVVHGLMVYSLASVRKRAIELLNNKLQHHMEFFADCDNAELCNILVAALINIIKTIEDGEFDPDQELIVQKALFALKLLARLLVLEFPEKFTEILDYLISLLSNDSEKVNENIRASLILCIAELCYTLKAHCIPHLNRLVPVLLKTLKSNRNVETPSLLLTSNVAAINKILDRLALFLSPYIEKLVYEMSLIACQWEELDEQKFGPFIKKIHSIQGKLATIPLNVLLPAIQSSYIKLIEGGNYAAVTPLMSILTETLSSLQGGQIQVNLPDLTEFFLMALEFRSNGQGTFLEANQVEEQVIKALLTLILKLSESTFRPLYCQVYDWAIHEGSKAKRAITFYNVSNAFANSLKGLFTTYAGHFINNSAKLLDNCNLLKALQLHFEDEDNNVALVENILKTLQAVFAYDSQRFINKERFDMLMQPLADQLENLLGGFEKLQVRAKTILIPCIVQFAVATADDAFWKQLNYQILLKTRHDSPSMRLVALSCLGEVAKKLGEDFVPLLPETVPFLAELLEDDEEEIEKSCKKTIQELEKAMGTSLQEYF